MTAIPIWLLVFETMGVALMNADFLAPYFSVGGGTLTLALIPLVGFVAAIGVGLAGREVERRQFWVCLVSLVLLVGLAFGRQLDARGPGPVPRGMHDGAVHTEEAAQALLDGRNPYTTDYRATPYAALNPRIPGGPEINVVWSHYIYPPITFLLQTPWKIVGQALGFRADVRWIYLVALLIVTALITSSSRSWTERSQWLLLTLGNPLVWLHVIVGYNDIVPALGVVAAAWAMVRKRWLMAGLIFGLALAAKQSVWIILPLWLAWLWWLRQHAQTAGAKRAVLGTGLAFVAAFGPFILWNAPALYDDIVRYASGSIPFSYPISGATFLQYLRVFGWINSPWTIVPAYLFQAMVGLPVLWFSLRWFWRQPSASRWLAGAAAMTLTVLVFSRYFNPNYLVTIIMFGVAAAAWQRQGAP